MATTTIDRKGRYVAMPIQMIQAAIQAPALMPLLLTQCLCALMLLGALNARMTGEQRLEPGFQFILEDLLGPAMLEQVDVTARGSSFLAQGVALLARWPIIIVAIVKRSFVVVFTGSLCGAPASSGSCNQGWEVHAALVVIPLVFTALSALFPLRGGQQFAHGLASATGTLHGLGAAIRVVYLAAKEGDKPRYNRARARGFRQEDENKPRDYPDPRYYGVPCGDFRPFRARTGK
jgi:hypothetical protein